MAGRDEARPASEAGAWRVLRRCRRSAKRRSELRWRHPFLYIKRHFGDAKVRYRGLSKNTQRLMTLLGFANLMRAEQYLAA